MKLVAEWGNFYITTENNGINRVFSRGDQFDTEVYQSFDYWRAENKLVSLAW